MTRWSHQVQSILLNSDPSDQYEFERSLRNVYSVIDSEIETDHGKTLTQSVFESVMSDPLRLECSTVFMNIAGGNSIVRNYLLNNFEYHSDDRDVATMVCHQILTYFTVRETVAKIGSYMAYVPLVTKMLDVRFDPDLTVNEFIDGLLTQAESLIDTPSNQVNNTLNVMLGALSERAYVLGIYTNVVDKFDSVYPSFIHSVLHQRVVWSMYYTDTSDNVSRLETIKNRISFLENAMTSRDGDITQLIDSFAQLCVCLLEWKNSI